MGTSPSTLQHPGSARIPRQILPDFHSRLAARPSSSTSTRTAGRNRLIAGDSPAGDELAAAKRRAWPARCRWSISTRPTASATARTSSPS
ncbi:MAG: hypothetical protein MZV70_46800 [Desulfobacterales bacterium]|nr:hypothetical protein [Desulfobacterales bacterium]